MSKGNLYLKNPYTDLKDDKCGHGRKTVCEACWYDLPIEIRIKTSMFADIPHEEDKPSPID
jgi:hypothetical protein